jgi:uncharacterized protein (TIGR02147 family)
MNNKSIFEFIQYKDFLQHRIETSEMKGIRSRMAEAMRCDLAYLSRVLNGSAHLGLEQADHLSHFFGLSQEEHHFFLLLVELARASTESLKRYFKNQMEEVLNDRLSLRNRLKSTSKLTEEAQIKYYSTWFYAAIHVMVGIPDSQDAASISRQLNLPLSKVHKILADLVEFGLVKEKGGKFQRSSLRIHLGSDEMMATKHHHNWRMKSMESIDRGQSKNLHYSSVISVGKKDIPKIKETMTKAIEEIREIVKDSEDEEVWSYCLDCFSIMG